MKVIYTPQKLIQMCEEQKVKVIMAMRIADAEHNVLKALVATLAVANDCVAKGLPGLEVEE